jgi:hypothetical protein
MILLIFNSQGAFSPIEFYDKDLCQFVESLNPGVSLCGYPEIMDSISALTVNQVKVNLGQGRKKSDAYEFYHMLNAYYSNDLGKVYIYLSINGYDFFVIRKQYFHSSFTENNNLFSFYPILRDYEEKLKKGNKNNFALLYLPKEIVEFETGKSFLISKHKLKDYINDRI